jgi:hypothetical protein
MADITGYILDSSLTGFVYDIGTSGVVAQFSVSGVSMDYVNQELSKKLNEVSLGSSFIWTNGKVDVSVAGGAVDVTKLYVDSSLAVRDSSITLLFNDKIDSTALYPFTTNASVNIAFSIRDASIGAMYTNSQIDSSFALKSGFAKITVGTSQPDSPSIGDLWIDIN